ncbi:MAG: hypothetical protein J0H17_06375 [Rhizobiales bacterium]|nr:hypothetical protein [Hyphomicrobiales bacterium]
MNVIDSHILERDAGGKPLYTFPHPALAATAQKRQDLKVRPLPEINLCMVYRPRPARIVTLNLSAWLLLEMCDGSPIGDILANYVGVLDRRGKQAPVEEADRGLQSLIDSELIIVSPVARQSGGSHE